MLSEVVDGSSSSPRRTHAPRHTFLQVEVALLRPSVLHELDRHEAAGRAHIADRLVPVGQRTQALEPGGLQRHHVLQHRLGFEDVECREGGRARRREP